MRLLEHYMAREPSPVERVEYIIAQLTAVYLNSKRANGAAPTKTADLLPFLKAWPDVMAIDEYQQTLMDLED